MITFIVKVMIEGKGGITIYGYAAVQRHPKVQIETQLKIARKKSSCKTIDGHNY